MSGHSAERDAGRVLRHKPEFTTDPADTYDIPPLPDAEKDAPEPEWVRRAVTLYDFFDGRITLRVAQPQPQYKTVQLNAEYKGDLISVDVDIDDLRAAIDAVDARVTSPVEGRDS